MRNSDLLQVGTSATLNALSGSADAGAIDMPLHRLRGKDNHYKGLVAGQRRHAGNDICFSMGHLEQNMFQITTGSVVVVIIITFTDVGKIGLPATARLGALHNLPKVLPQTAFGCRRVLLLKLYSPPKPVLQIGSIGDSRRTNEEQVEVMKAR